MHTYTVAQIAEKLQVSEKAVKQLIKAGDLEAFDVSIHRNHNKKLRVTHDAYLAFIRMRSTRPEPKPTTRRKRRKIERIV